MATFTREVGIIFGSQSVEGTADSTVAAQTTASLANGAVRGDVASGIVESGVTHAFTRRLRESGPVTGGFTELASDFLEEEIALSFAFPMAGNRETSSSPVVDEDFDHDQGINDLLAACGLAGAADASGTDAWIYTPADVSIATARIFDSGVAWVIRDIRGDWSLAQTPGEVGIMTCTLSGIVDSFDAAETFPTFSYGVQATVNAPSVKSVAAAWNITRGWTDLTISCVNEIETIPDSNSSTGSGFEQNGRTITVAMTIRDDSTDTDFSRTHLIAETAPTDDLIYTVFDSTGTPTGVGESALAYKIEANNLEVQSYTPDVAGKKSASNVTAICTGLTDGSEFALTFL